MGKWNWPLIVGCVVEYIVPGVVLGLIAPKQYPWLFVPCVAAIYAGCKMAWYILKDTPARRAIRQALANSLEVDKAEDVPKAVLTRDITESCV